MTPSPVHDTSWRRHEDFFTTSDGTRIGFSDTGNQSPVTVLFLHGWTQNREAWDDVAAPLHERDPGLRIVAIDHRGHGRSDPAPGGTVNLTQLASDVAEFIAAKIPTGQIVIVGHSMGGMTVMRLGAIRPDLVAQRISGAIFVATSAGKLLKPLRLVEPVFGAVISVVLGVLGQGWVIRQGYLMLPFIATMVFGRNPRPHDVRRVWDQIRSGDPRAYQEAAAGLLHNDLYDGLQAYRGKPVAVLAGSRDFLTPAKDSRDMAAVLQTNELRTYPGSGHMLPNERAIEVVNEIVGVLDSVETSRTATNVFDEPSKRRESS